MRTYILIILTLIFFFSCEEGNNFDMAMLDQTFNMNLEVAQEPEQFNLNDTLWIISDIPKSAIDLLSGSQIDLNNATVLMSGRITKILGTSDTTNFVETNFTMTAQTGTIELVNVINDVETSFEFDVKYGLPDESAQLKVGVIANYPGVFALQASGNIYYGDDRSNYDLLSDDNTRNAYVQFTFGGDTHEELFYNLPSAVYSQYKDSFPTEFIQAGKYYFFEVK